MWKQSNGDFEMLYILYSDGKIFIIIIIIIIIVMFLKG